MQIDAIFIPILVILIITQGLLLLWNLFQRNHTGGKVWFIVIVLLSIIVTTLQALPNDWIIAERISRDFLVWLTLIAIVAAFGRLLINDVVPPQSLSTTHLRWLGISVLWALLFTGAALLSAPFNFNLQASLSMPTSVGIIGAIIATLFILGISIYHFYIAPMPEVANRSAFWLVATILLIFSLTLVASGAPIVMLAGTLFLLITLFILSYGIRSYRLVDIRHSILILVRTISVIAIAWGLIFATLYFFILSRFASELTSNDTNEIVLAVVALVIATAIVPARQVITFIFEWLAKPSRPNLASATAQYSQRVARAATVEDVVNATTDTLNRIMGVRRSALILINNTVRVKDSVELIVMEMGASLSNPSRVGYLHENSPIYQVLAEYGVPIGQYDIDYSPAFQQLSPQEKQFFNDNNMSIYVPVKADNRLIGLLASSTKNNDTPYNRDDIELLTVIGQQVGTALRSARLIDDLQHLNDSMRVLNKRLEGAKVELEKLDGIKTDFITIASHELRTPLAQIRGYTDILDSLNQANALKEGQADMLVGNLRKSTERMEELISAMLDVSQIDVNSMDLRFIRTSPETITKMALEPLRDPAEERNITIIRHSAKDLPNLDADLQRMVQALRNIILNAIKFTPDGGRIEIFSTLEKAQNEQGVDHILFTIQDSGVGIDKKDIDFIFNKFYRAFDTQLHSSGIYKFMGAGPGLGLTIAKGIIEGHGGYVWAESERHDMQNPPGTVFYVRLPIEPPSGTRRVLPFEDDLHRTQLPISPVD